MSEVIFEKFYLLLLLLLLLLCILLLANRRVSNAGSTYIAI